MDSPVKLVLLIALPYPLILGFLPYTNTRNPNSFHPVKYVKTLNPNGRKYKIQLHPRTPVMVLGLWQRSTNSNHRLRALVVITVSHDGDKYGVGSKPEVRVRVLRGGWADVLVLRLGLGFLLQVVDHTHNQKVVIRKRGGSR